MTSLSGRKAQKYPNIDVMTLLLAYLTLNNEKRLSCILVTLGFCLPLLVKDSEEGLLLPCVCSLLRLGQHGLQLSGQVSLNL